MSTHLQLLNYNKKGYHFTGRNLFANILSVALWKETTKVVMVIDDKRFNDKNVLNITTANGFIQLKYYKQFINESIL